MSDMLDLCMFLGGLIVIGIATGNAPLAIGIGMVAYAVK